MVTRKELGNRGEEEACRFLEGHGYRIIERNFRCREGEIDIVAAQGGVLVFVEVRTRSGENFGTPEESITPRKQARLRKVAVAYLMSRSERVKSWGYRFDVVTFRLTNGLFNANLIKGAF